MNAIRIVKQLESDRLPELTPLLGKKVEIIVLEEPPFPRPKGKDVGRVRVNGRLHRCGRRRHPRPQKGQPDMILADTSILYQSA